MSNQLFLGDNLHVLQNEVDEESVDLIYLDPPFHSQRDYRATGVSSRSNQPAFSDTWRWDDDSEAALQRLGRNPASHPGKLLEALALILTRSDLLAYLTFMTSRLVELHRVLRPTGSLYLHGDPTASHYLKMILDSIFGRGSFQNEIIWRRTAAHNKTRRWAPIHDTVLFYTRSEAYTWNPPSRPYMAAHVETHFARDGEEGYKTHYYGNVLTGSGRRSGESGLPWKGIDPSLKDRHWAIPGKLWEETGLDPSGLTQHQRLDLLYELGLITIEPGAAWPIYARAVNPREGTAVSDLWAFQPSTEGTVWGTREGIDADVSWLKPGDAERVGFPTQKPLSLLKRIIQASSHVGDLVLDPFCGSGTTLHASEILKRRWIGVDRSALAIELATTRLEAVSGCQFRLKPAASSRTDSL